MKLTPVNSSMISNVGYDASSQTLRLQFFNTGKTVDYLKVPKHVYSDLMASKSKGTFVINFVMNCYDHQYVQVVES